MSNGVYTQTRFRFRNDNGTEATATWAGNTNQNVTLPVDSVFRLRIQAEQTNTDLTGNIYKRFGVKYSRNGGSYTSPAPFGATNSPVRYAFSPHEVGGNYSPQRLTSGSGFYFGGYMLNSDRSVFFAFDYAHTWVGYPRFFEFELIFELYGPELNEGDTIDFRIYSVQDSDTVLDTYSVTPRATATFIGHPDSPTLQSPANGAEITSASQHSFSWQFNGQEPGDTQAAFVFKREGFAYDLANNVDSLRLQGVKTANLIDHAEGLGFSPDGSIMAVCESFDDNYDTLFNRYSTRIYSTSDWGLVTTVATEPHPVNGLEFSPDGNLLIVTYGFPGRVADNASPGLRIYNTSNWSAVSGTPTFTRVRGTAFSPNGTWLALRTDLSISNAEFKVYNTSDWTEVTGVPVIEQVVSFAFSNDSSILFTVSRGTNDDRAIRIIDTSNWSIVTTIVVTYFANVNCCAFSHDGALLALASGPVVRVLDTSDWSQVIAYSTPNNNPAPGATNTVNNTAFSPDDKFLAISHTQAPALSILRTSDWSVANVTRPLGDMLAPDLVTSTSSFISANYLDFSPSVDGKYTLAVAHNIGTYISLFQNYGAEYWNGTNWQLSETFITSANEQVAFPSRSWEPWEPE